MKSNNCERVNGIDDSLGAWEATGYHSGLKKRHLNSFAQRTDSGTDAGQWNKSEVYASYGGIAPLYTSQRVPSIVTDSQGSTLQ